MASNENIQQRVNELYIELSGHITSPTLDTVKEYLYKIIPAAELEKCHRFTDICHRLTSAKKINPNDHNYLEGLFQKIYMPNLWTIVEDFQREQNENSEPPIPLTCLYNQEMTLPIGERLEGFLNILRRVVGEDQDTIPQQLFYANVAAGIARPGKDLLLQLGKDVSVSVPKGAVNESKIIYCHYVEGHSPCLLPSGENLVCYSIPVFLGPPGESFKTGHPVDLEIPHKAIPPSKGTYGIRFFVKQSNDSEWKEGGEHFCKFMKNGPATIHLQHFSEFVIGADPSSVTNLPLLKARLDTRVICITETERRLVICLMFDSPFTIKKAKEIIGKLPRGTCLTGEDIELQPIVPCQMEVKGDSWQAKDPIKDITREELSTLVFKPIVREVTMVLQKDHASTKADTKCQITITQNTDCQRFTVSETTFKLSIDTTCSVIYHQIDTATKRGQSERAFLEKLVATVKKDNVSLEYKEVEPTADGKSYNMQVLELIHKHLCDAASHKQRIILAFPDKEYIEAELMDVVKETLKKGQHFVTIILYNHIFFSLPNELAEFDLRRIEVDRDLDEVDVKAVSIDLSSFLKDIPETVDLAFMNSGTGLALSYYFGYLWHILPKFNDHIDQSKWREANMDIPEKNISKTMFICFPTNCREPEVKDSKRIKFTANKMPLDTAGLHPNYDFDFREIVSKDGSESYYCMVYYLNVIQSLVEMRDDPNKSFVKLSEEKMRKEGKYCFERLKMFLKYAYNDKIKIDPSKYKLIEYNTEAENANEKLADEIFDCIKERNETKPRASRDVMRQAPGLRTGVLFFEKDSLCEEVKNYLNCDIGEARMISDTSREKENVILHGYEIIDQSDRIIMVLDEQFVESSEFDCWFYTILDRNISQDKEFDRRALIVLDCLENGIANLPGALNLNLFSYVSYKDEDWRRKVTAELNGEPLSLTHDLMLLNIGTGLALSWYYMYLKIRVPTFAKAEKGLNEWLNRQGGQYRSSIITEIVDVINKCDALKKKFNDRLMSHKLFILHPHSCKCHNMVSDADVDIKEVDAEAIKLPHIMKWTRDYTIKPYSILDTDGKEYWVMVDYNTQAETLHRMKQEGFLTESIIATERERYFNKLKTLVCHPKEPMKLIERFKTIEYNDENIQTGDLAKLLLKHIKYEIEGEAGQLPHEIDNGATIEIDRAVIDRVLEKDRAIESKYGKQILEFAESNCGKQILELPYVKVMMKELL